MTDVRPAAAAAAIPHRRAVPGRDGLRSVQRAAALVEFSADLIFMLDRQFRVVTFNPATESLLHPQLGQPVGKLLADIVHPDDLQMLRARLAGSYQHRGPRPTVTFRVTDHRGGWRHLAVISSNQLDDPAVDGVIFNARDVTNEVLALEQVRAGQRALTDALIRATEFRDPYTAGHQRQVATLARRIAVRLGLPDEDVDTIELGASLHDIGKISVPAEILAWPGRLSVHQLALIRRHSQVGVDILGTTGLPPGVRDIILHHHERLDGSGYPDGLAGDEIALAARIVAVADVMDAMTSHRPYRPGLGLAAAGEEIARGSATVYDRDVVAAALAVTADPSTSGPQAAGGRVAPAA